MHSRGLAAWVVLGGVLIGLAGCFAGNRQGSDLAWACCRTVAGIRSLTSTLKLPEHFRQRDAIRRGDEFDVNSYFRVFDSLSMVPGYALDYVYLYQGLGGRPVLYARPQIQQRFATYRDLTAVHPEPRGLYLSHVRADGTPTGYLQLVLLALMGEQFYLFWHAGYNDIRPVCSREAIEGILSELDDRFPERMSSTSRKQASLINAEPWVYAGEAGMNVRLVTFSLWGGFVERVYDISHSYPHTIVSLSSSILVEFDCDLMF